MTSDNKSITKVMTSDNKSITKVKTSDNKSIAKVMTSNNNYITKKASEDTFLLDSGVYSCLATNPVGQIKREFYLTVESPQVELPVIKHITNTTVYQV